MPEIPPLLESHACFDLDADMDELLASVPAKWVIYLLCDGDDRPLQLLCVKNLRASLKRRLGENQPLELSRRLDYRALVRHIHWRRVDSAFEADWLYHELARELFPQSYRGMVGLRPAWFIHVNPEQQFPRYIKTTDLSRQGLYIGPLEDKHAAARLIQVAEDTFDLCRYYQILVEAPRGHACAYKEMGKCPAPCDGSISMPQYRQMVHQSAAALVDPTEQVEQQRLRMQEAAAGLRFEEAARIKAKVDQLLQIGKGAFRHARSLENFRFAIFQHGPKEGLVKVFVAGVGTIAPALCLIDSPRSGGQVIEQIEQAAADMKPGHTADAIAAERIGIVAQHLFSSPADRGQFIRLDELDEKKIEKAYRELLKRPPRESADSEGVLKELQSL